nr:hypothetical protein [Saccharopolyspora shandongensis]
MAGRLVRQFAARPFEPPALQVARRGIAFRGEQPSQVPPRHPDRRRYPARRQARGRPDRAKLPPVAKFFELSATIDLDGEPLRTSS